MNTTDHIKGGRDIKIDILKKQGQAFQPSRDFKK